MDKTLAVVEASQVGEVRRVAADMARVEEMSEDEIGRVSLVATEVSTNLVKYGKLGAVTLRRYAEGGMRGVEIVAVDSGPGFPNVAASMRDGHSTAGTLGIGLGTIQRASTYFDLYTVAGQGTALLARIEHGPRRAKPAAAAGGFMACACAVPKKGQAESGDGWGSTDFGHRQLLCIVDGLGHGPLAALATRRALASFEAAGATEPPGDILMRAHEDLRGSRGAVMAVLALDPASSTAVFAGIGNITAAVVHDGRTHHLFSVEGIVGYRLRKVREQRVPWAAGAAAILNTDGVSARWNLARYPGLLLRHPQLIASVLFRDHARETDDATMVVAKGP